jgi:solute carrier family 9 (sodium/hydrogen exchanger), member 8
MGGLVKLITGKNVGFSGNLFFYLVLPPIIFSAGYSLKRKRFFQYIHQITFFGIFGTIINFVLIAISAYTYSTFIGLRGMKLDWHESFLLSSVLAGSDEVSAMSLVRIKDYPRM